MTRCRCCNGPVEELFQPVVGIDSQGRRRTLRMDAAQTCKNPDCPLVWQTINHAQADLSRYGCTQHPDWKAPTE